MMTFLSSVLNVVTALWRTTNRWGRALVIFLLGWPLFFMINLLLPHEASMFVISVLPVVLIVIVSIANWDVIPWRAQSLLIAVGIWPLILWLITLAEIPIIAAIFCILPLIMMSVALIDVWNLNPRWMRIVLILITFWQLVIFAALLLPQEMFVTALSFLPIAGLIILPVLFPDAAGIVAVFETLENGKKILVGIGIAIGIELAIGVYFSVVPFNSAYGLIPLVVLIIFTLVFLSIGTKPDKTLARIRFLLTFVLVVITLIFLFKKLFPTATTAVASETVVRADSALTQEVRTWFAPPPPPPSPDTIMVAPRTDENSNSHDYVMTTIPQSGYTMPIGTNIGIELSKKWTGLMYIDDGVRCKFQRPENNTVVNIAFDDDDNGRIDKNDRVFYGIRPDDGFGMKEGNKRFKLSGTGTVVISASYR